MNIRHFLILGLYLSCQQVYVDHAYSDESPVFYGLNESNSRSWAQLSSNGVVGISYFQRFCQDTDEGTLFYERINTDGSSTVDSITTGRRLEKSVLLFDPQSNPHIFVACSDDFNQTITHYSQNGVGQWRSDVIYEFNNVGGKFIFELSADAGPDGSFHILILKSRSDIDSEDFNWAWLDSNLYHLTNASGSWHNELIHHFDMGYNSAFYIKSSSRQDIKVDNEGYVHVTFNEQINSSPDPSRLWYGTNHTGIWEIELAFTPAPYTRDDAGWFPSLCLNNDGIPYIACTYVKHVPTWSARYAKLFLVNRVSPGNWATELVASQDDLYYGNDGRRYTGALTHLVFDDSNNPHILFSDIASSHWGYNRLNVGNIRYGVFRQGAWQFNTIYRSPLPVAFLNATEIHGLCLIYSDQVDSIRVIGQELDVDGEYDYSCRLLKFAWERPGHTMTQLQEYSAVIGERGVEISWTVSGGEFAEYDVLRATEPEADYRKLHSPEIFRNGHYYTYTDHSCEPGNIYSYRVVIHEDNEQWSLFNTDAILVPYTSLVLYQNIPNPFNPQTIIAFDLPNRSAVDIRVFDMSGRLVRVLLDNDIYQYGRNEVAWNGRDDSGQQMPSGTYLYRLKSVGYVETKRMTLLR